MARFAGLIGLLGGCTGTASEGEPNGVIPRSAGELRRKMAVIGTTASAIAAMIKDAVRQLWSVATVATIGRNMSCPVALPAVSTPVIRPLRLRNQRSAISAAKTS